MPVNVCPDDSFLDDGFTCRRCETRYPPLQGYEFNANCGLDARGSPVRSVYRPCGTGTFNDGSSVTCRKCASCVSPRLTASPCGRGADAVCCGEGERVFNGRCVGQPVMPTPVMPTPVMPTPVMPTQVMPTTAFSSESSSYGTSGSISSPNIITAEAHVNNTSLTVMWTCVAFLSMFLLISVCLLFIWRKRIKRWTPDWLQTEQTQSVHRNYRESEGMTSLCLEKPCRGDSENILAKHCSENSHASGSSYCVLAPEIQAAPLSAVLNNLDVLEELILLLDPDTSAVKNTRHLAAQCSFSFAWINYAYSMKDHKSPLVAVLEGVVTKNPSWTVGHLAGLLAGIGRNDAVEVLTKLPVIVDS